MYFCIFDCSLFFALNKRDLSPEEENYQRRMFDIPCEKSDRPRFAGTRRVFHVGLVVSPLQYIQTAILESLSCL